MQHKEQDIFILSNEWKCFLLSAVIAGSFLGLSPVYRVTLDYLIRKSHRTSLTILFVLIACVYYFVIWDVRLRKIAPRLFGLKLFVVFHVFGVLFIFRYHIPFLLFIKGIYITRYIYFISFINDYILRLYIFQCTCIYNHINFYNIIYLQIAILCIQDGLTQSPVIMLMKSHSIVNSTLLSTESQTSKSIFCNLL